MNPPAERTVSLDSSEEATVLRERFRPPVRFPELHVYVDGAAKGNPGPAGIGVVVLAPDGETVAEFGMAIGETTNNYAEYTALVHALRLLTALEVEGVVVFTDSELVARQLSGEYRVREPSLKTLHEQAMRLLSRYPRWRVEHVERERNREADRLASRAAAEAAVGRESRSDPGAAGCNTGRTGGKEPRLF